MSTNRTMMKSFHATIASLILLPAFNAALAQPFAYISNQGSNSVSVINTATNLVVATVPVGSSPYGVAANVAGNRVYVTNSGGTSVSVIDTATATVAAIIGVGTAPNGIAVSPDGTRVYVANSSNSVSVINTTTNLVTATVPTTGTTPFGVAVNPAGTRVYVTHNNSSNMNVIDTSTNTVVGNITLGSGLKGTAVLPDGTRVYAVDGLGNLWVINTATNTVVTAVLAGSSLSGIAVHPAGNRLYVTNAGANNVRVFDTTTNTFIATVPTVPASLGIAINAAGTLVYAADFTTNNVSVIDAATNTVSATVPVGTNPVAFGAFLSIGGPAAATFPGAPTIGTASAGNASASVTYTPPGSDGGSPIMSYTATSNPAGGTGVATGGPIIVTGLTNGVPYTFTVTATNAIGTGPSSAASNSVMPGIQTATIVPASIPYGNVPLTVPITQTVTFTNTSGTGAFYLITALSTFDARFVATGSGASPCNVGVNVLAGGSCAYDLTFTPNGTGAYNNTTTVTYQPLAAGPTFTATQISNGTGFTPPSAMSPSGLAFGNVPLTLAQTQSFTFTNNSNTTLFPSTYTLTNIVTSGLGYTAVGSGGNPCAVGLMLAAGANCSMTVTFQIGGVGTSGGTTTITFLAGLGANPTYTQSIGSSGTGFSMPATATPTSLPFGNVTVGVPTPLSFNFTNTSNLTAFPSTYLINNLVVAGLGYTAAGSGGTPCTVSLMLAPGASCGITITFTPTGTGSSGGTKTISYLAGLGTNPQYALAVPLSGTGVSAPPAVTVSGTTAFPSTVLGASSVLQAITITNSGGTTLALNGITHSNASVFPDTTGGPAPNVTHYCGFGSSAGGAPNTGSPINIAPGNSCTLNLIFSPNAVGSLSGTITINSNATPGVNTIALSGTGLPPTATINQTGLPAGTVVPGLAANMAINVSGGAGTPTGSVTVRLHDLSSNVVTDINGGTCLNVGLISGSFTCPFTTPAAGNYQVEVTYSGDGTYISTLTSFSLTTAQAVPTITQSGSPSMAVPGQSVSMAITVSSSSPLGPPTGSVTVRLHNLGSNAVTDINGGTCLNVGLISGSFTCPYITPAAGNYQVEVTFSGDAPNAPKLTAFPLTTAQAVPTITQMGSPSNAVPGQSVSMAITVSSSSPLGPPTGSVTVRLHDLGSNAVTDINGGTCLNVGLSSGSFTCPYTTPVVGNYQIEVSYAGDTPNAPKLTSFPLTITATPTPTMTVGFAPTSVPVATNATMTLTLANPNAGPASVVLGSIVSVPGLTLSGIATTCAGLFPFVAGSSIDLGMSGTIPAMGSCTVTVNAQSAGAGSFPVTVSPGNLSTTLGANANTSTATLTVTAPVPPTVALSLSQATTAPGNAVGLVLNIANPGGTALSAGVFTFTYPAGAVTGVVPGIVNSCGGTVTSTAGSTALNAGGLALGAGNTCAIGVSVSAATGGSYVFNFAAGGLSSSVGSNAAASSATLTVSTLLPPSISFAAAPSSIVVNGTAVGTLTINNPNATPLVANAFTFNYLPGLVNAPAPNATSTCVGAAPTATPGVGNSTQPTSFTLLAGGSCTFSVTFTSATAGTYSGNIAAGLIVTPGGSSNATPFSLTVTPAPTADVTLSSAALIFGTRTVNTTSPAQTVTLTNSGAANLVIASITGSGDFGFTTACPLLTPPLSPAGSCNINITFTPLTIAALTGNVTITSNAPGSPHVISLTGTGAAVPVPGINLSPSTLNFGSQPIGSSALLTVVVTNTGFATLTLSSVNITGPFGRVAVPADCAANLAPGNTCQIGVGYSPSAIASSTGQITITDNAAGSPHLVALTGNGVVAPVSQISVGSTLDFGDQIIATTGTQGLLINNTGGATLNISSVTITGTNAASFIAANTCTTVAPGSSCRLDIAFTPTTTGAKTAQLNITSDSGGPTRAAGAGTNVITLTGNGTLASRPIAKLSVTAVGYGNTIFAGATPTQLVTVTNIGGLPMSITSIQATGDFLQMNSCPTSVAVGASCNISVMFSPLGLGNRAGELQVFTNADGSPHRVLLGGTGCRWFSQQTSRFLIAACG